MVQGWRLGPHDYLPDASRTQAEAVSQDDGRWVVARRDGEGPRCLLQLWEPRPPERDLDRIREAYLFRFSQVEGTDPGSCHLGFDRERVWFIQELAGTPLNRVWARAGTAGRDRLRARLQAALVGSRTARLLVPEVIGVLADRLVLPRLLGAPVQDPAALLAALDREPPAPGAGEPPLAEEPPDLADGSCLPLRGRIRELTYLKSLMLGLGAGLPSERVVVIQGEAGLGHDRLSAWAAAVAETEGIWVSDLDLYPGEHAGAVLGRLVGELVGGLAAECYAAHPSAVRTLAGRVAGWDFLRDHRRVDPPAAEVAPEQMAAALQVLAFAQARQPRLVVVRGLERAAPDAPGLVKDLALDSTLPWVLSARDQGGKAGLRSCLAVLKNSPQVAAVVLDRLEDEQLAQVLEDLLGPHDLPEPFLAGLCTASLGNPGLLHDLVELAQDAGTIHRRAGRWQCAEDAAAAPEPREGQVAAILSGRLRRLSLPGLAAVRMLALADEPLAISVLVRALHRDGDEVAEAVHGAAGARLVLLLADGRVAIAGTQVRDLVLAQMPGRDHSREALDLLRAREGPGFEPLLAVRLQTYAVGRETALAQAVTALDEARVAPQEAERLVEEALQLLPTPLQQARLWEFLAEMREGNAGLDCAEAASDAAAEPGGAPLGAAMDALEQAVAAVERIAGWPAEECLVRLQRKKGLLELRQRRFELAGLAIERATSLLADHPFHPEQAWVRLASGRLRLAQGTLGEALALFESGLELVRTLGPEHGRRDRIELLLELGRAQGEAAQFQGALTTLDALRRLGEHHGDRRTLAQAQAALGRVRLAMGQAETAAACLEQAVDLARSLGDAELLAGCQLDLGIVRSRQELLEPALANLSQAERRFEALGDGIRATRALAWRARDLAALGDQGLADLLLMRVAAGDAGRLTRFEQAERAWLEAEIAGLRAAWDQAWRGYQAAANRFAHAGLVWRERLARLRAIQAQAQEAAGVSAAGRPTDPRPAWLALESLKGPVDGSGSRWQELEWHRAHALLLVQAGLGRDIQSQALEAWRAVQEAAQDGRFPALAVEAGARAAELLEERGDRLGARERIQAALPCSQLLWTQLPASCEQAFLNRPYISAFLAVAEGAGLRLSWPARKVEEAAWEAGPALDPVQKVSS
jgi:tetratricopeptide (TPR) repeat protein